MTVGRILKDVLVSAAVEGTTEGAQQAYLNQIASKLEGYDPNRPFDQEVFDSMLVGAVVGGGSTAVSQGGQAAFRKGKPEATPPPSNEGGTAGNSADLPIVPPYEPAIDRINRGIRETSDKSAKDSAQTFEPALAEKANTPPPSKSAAKSAAVFQDVATTEEAGAKVDSQQEEKAQRLVDEVAAATGRSREDVIATRNGDTAAWMKDLEYQKDPIRVDPDRRIRELKEDLSRLDSEWQQHVAKAGSEAERARSTEAWMNGIRERQSQLRADQTANQERTAARAGDVEAALSEAERVRRSPKSAEVLKKDLTARSQPTTREAQLMARRAAIETELVKAERTRQSNAGGAALKNDLSERSSPSGKSAVMSTVDEVSGLDADGFSKWEKANGGQTGASNRIGIQAIGKTEEIAALKKAGAAAKAEWRQSFEEAKNASPETREAAENRMHRLAAKDQFFSEAVSAAEGNGSALQDDSVIAAHLLHGENFDREWRDQGGQGGRENQIVIKNGRVYKRNYSQKLGKAVPNHGSIEAFNQHVKLHNELFPSAQIKHEGMSQTSDGPAPVISQEEIKSVRTASTQEIRAHMKERGFVPDGEDTYVNAEKRLRVKDLHDDNVLVDRDGKLHVIDPVIQEIGGNQAKSKTPPVTPASPTASSVNAESASAAKGANNKPETPSGSPATKTVDKPEPARKPKGPSRSEIAQQTKKVREMASRLEPIAAKYPDRAKELQKRVQFERDTLTQMQADKTEGSAPKVGLHPNGESDLLSDIADLVGTIRTVDPTGRGGESDGMSEALSRGAARLLRGREGMAPDQALEILNEAGYKFKTIGEMTEAISRAVEDRRKIGAALKTQAYEQKVQQKVLGGENPKAKGSLPIEELGVGSKFKIDGEKFSVVDVEETAEGTFEYIVQDGVKFRVPEGTRIFPDSRSVKNKAKSADEVIASIEAPEQPAAGELIPGNEVAFNLASDEQKEAAAPAPTAEKTDEMFGSEVRTTPPTAMDRRNAEAREMVAPVSAHVETHTPETLEGEKLNRSWTAFAADAGSLNVPRAEMPQIKSEHRGALVNFLKARGITATTALVDPSKLKPTQAEYSEAKVQRAREFEGSERPILISADNHVVDGHHQWMASLDDAAPLGVIRLNAPIDQVLADMAEFPSVEQSTGAKTAAKAATPTDKIIGKLEALLEKNKAERSQMLGSELGISYSIAEEAAIRFAILGIRTGRAVADMVRMAIERFKAAHPKHTEEDVAKLTAAIHEAVAAPEVREKTRTKPSEVPISLRDAGAPVKDIGYDIRGHDPRKAEAAEIVRREGREKAEALMSDASLPGDTRVAIGGNLINERMFALQDAKPSEVSGITSDIQRITAALQPLGTTGGQQVSMFGGIYQDVRVANAMEYVKSVQKKRGEQMGPEGQKAAKEAATAINAAKTDADKIAAIEKLKKKFSTAPATKMLNELQRLEKIRELNRLGVLTADDLVNVAGNAIGIPAIDQKKLKHIAELADRVENATNHAERSRAELELTDVVNIYKGVAGMDIATSMYTGNILSGYTTQGTNVQSTALNTLWQLSTAALANPSKVPELLRSLPDGIKLGFKQAGAILATGRSTQDLQDKTGRGANILSTVNFSKDYPSIPKPVGAVMTGAARAVEKVYRVMKAADSVFYYPAREAYARLATVKLLEGKYEGAELRRKIDETLHVTPAAFESARSQAEKEGYRGFDLGIRTSEIIEERRKDTEEGAAAVEQSERFAAKATFTEDPVGLAGVAYHALKYAVDEAKIGPIKILKPALLFLKTPANVFNVITDATPIGFVRAKRGMRGAGFRSPETLHFNADERRRLYIQATIGSALMAGMLLRALNGKDDFEITAKGPTDINHKKQLQQAGWIPYSIRVGKHRVSFKDTPLVIPLSIIGNVADSIRFQKSKSDLVLGNKVADAVASSPSVIFDFSMLNGLGDLMEAAHKGDMKKIGRTLTSIPANLLIPYNRLLQQIDQTFDNQTYDNNPVTGSVPFVRRTGTPQTDVQGRPNKYDPMSRFGSEETNDPVDMILRAKNVFIPEVGKDQKLGNGVMTDEQRDRMRKFSGQRIRVRLQASIPILRTMNQENAQKLVNRISEEERNAARRMISLRPASP
jgi:hypothetical protein